MVSDSIYFGTKKTLPSNDSEQATMELIKEQQNQGLPARLRELAEELDNLDTRELGDYAYRIHMKSDITDPLRELAATLTQVKEGE